MAAYSFLDVNLAIVGPGGEINLGSGAGAAEEGVTLEASEDKNVMTIGADGKGQHSLIASDACKLTIRLLKTSPANAKLMAMYDLQSATSKLWGLNVLTLVNTASQDYTVIQNAAFSKKPTLTYAKEAGMNEWTFDGIKATTILGANQIL